MPRKEPALESEDFLRHTAPPMHRLIASLIALSIVFASVAWAGDVHEEALTGQHVSADQDNGDTPSKIPGPCDHCCHGNGHQLALSDGDVMSVAIHVEIERPVPLRQPASWLQTPPTPPPNS